MKIIETKNSIKFVHPDSESATETRDTLRDEGMYSTLDGDKENEWIVILKKEDLIQGYIKQWKGRCE